jgi:nitrate reductase NapE component
VNPPLYLVVIGLEFPVVMALLDCWQRPPDHFLEGAEDRRAWLRWLVVAVVTVPILLGYGIVLGYYFAVVRRNSPAARS